MKITTNKEGIGIELHGKEQFWSLRAKISIPLNSIQDVRFEESFQDWRKWQIRMPGTNAPKLLLAGSYWTEEGWDFLYTKRPAGFYKPKLEDVLVIETDQNKYRRIILSTSRDEAKLINKWWQAIKSKKTA